MNRERIVLQNLRSELVQLDVTNEHKLLLDNSLTMLEDMFLVVVVGEFNAGKSAFINALLGKVECTEGSKSFRSN